MEAWVDFEACPQVTADHLAFPLPDVSLPSSSLLGAVIPLGHSHFSFREGVLFFPCLHLKFIYK